MPEESRNAQEKALRINLDAQRFGTFAEIGAGQEVARWFFHVGKASATVAKSISAYDMSISDSLYGSAGHYVSRARLEAMLQHEYESLTERLAPARGDHTGFFVFADTVATRAGVARQPGHGWLGVRFQVRPGDPPSQVIIHIQMQDLLAVNQQETVGLIGVNLLYAAFYHPGDAHALLGALLDGLSRRRVEVDMIKFSGPAYAGVDNRLMSLLLVERDLADAAMFTAEGEVVQPSEVLYKRPVLVERGSFRPVTNVTTEMADRALAQLHETGGPVDPVVLMEMTLNNLMSGPEINHEDFLARVDLLGAVGKMVLISDYTTFDRVTDYLRQYTAEEIGMVMGVPTLRQIFDEKFYADLRGGILEGLGRLFSAPAALFVYPTVNPSTNELETAEAPCVSGPLSHLYTYLRETGSIVPIREFDPQQLHISPAEVLEMIQTGRPEWEALVPPPAAKLIRERALFGYHASGAAGI